LEPDYHRSTGQPLSLSWPVNGDTTSTYWETDRADAAPGQEQGPTAEAHLPSDGDDHDDSEEVEQGRSGFRTYGKSRDHRPDLPQVVVGMAVTRSGIPIRVWSWPGDTGDSPLIRQVKADLKAWKLGRVVWVADRGFTSAVNRRFLQRGGGHYIMGEKLRHGSTDAQQALKRQGRYKTVAGNLQVKESGARRRHHARSVHRVPQPRRSAA
jgi:transposase